MEEYVYQEGNYIKRKDLKEFNDIMIECDFMPEEIEDEHEFNIVFQYLVNLTEKAPDFLVAYEYILRMITLLEDSSMLDSLKLEIQNKWISSCERIAKVEKIFGKQVLWGWQENRPLIRGLYVKADNLWKEKEFESAHDLFKKILDTNENDNVGARYSVKATAEKIQHDEFEKRFTIQQGDGSSYYNSDALTAWFGAE
jgi:hypothetical protein